MSYVRAGCLICLQKTYLEIKKKYCKYGLTNNGTYCIISLRLKKRKSIQTERKIRNEKTTLCLTALFVCGTMLLPTAAIDKLQPDSGD